MKHITEDKAIITGIIIVFLLAAAHNYDALRHFAIGAGVAPRLAWTTPGFIDLFIGVSVWVTLRNKRYAEPARLGWAIVIIFTFVSFVLNMMHYPQTAGGVAMALIVPSVVFCAAELGKGLVESTQKRQTVVKSLAEMTDENDRLTRQIEQKQQALNTLDSAISDRQIEVKRASIADMQAAREAKMEERRHKVLTLFNQEMTQTEMAESLDVSESTIARDIKALRELGALNGNGVTK